MLKADKYIYDKDCAPVECTGCKVAVKTDVGRVHVVFDKPADFPIQVVIKFGNH